MKKLIALSLLIISSTAYSSLSIAIEYNFTPIQLGGSASAINNLNQVVGTLNDSAFFWDNGQVTDLGFDLDSKAYDINDQSVITGTVDNARFGQEAFIWANGVSNTYINNREAAGLAVNNNNQVLGTNSFRNFDEYGYLIEGDQVTPIEVNNHVTQYPFNHFVEVNDLNDNGQVVGFIYDTTSGYGVEGFIWENGIDRSLGNFLPALINNNGLMVGTDQTFIAGFNRNNIIYDNGSLTNMGVFDSRGMNDLGQIVGNGVPTLSIGNALLWDNGQLLDLQSMVNDTADGWTLLSANDINDNGWIVGTAINDISGDFHMYVMSPTTEVSPVPEAPNLVLLAVGSVILLGINKRYKKQISLKS